MAADDYREARAAGQAARPAQQPSSPWYRKKRYLLGIPLFLILIGFVLSLAGAVLTGTSGGTSVGSGIPVPQSSQALPAVGDLVRVGSLDLTVTNLNTAFDAGQYNHANRATVAIAFRATNARGDEGRDYEFLPGAFKVVDTAGVTYPLATCSDCPGEFATRGLIVGGALDGTAYFEVPAGVTLTELIYAPARSDDRARISLR